MILIPEAAVPKCHRFLSQDTLRRCARLMPLAAALAMGACNSGSDPLVGGSADAGAAHIVTFGCGGCHRIPGIPGADGLVGPPLDMMARRVYVAGLLLNTPDNMVRWITDPQSVVPGNAMPNMGITAGQARDITAYLYTLR
jgi:cytochrome c2